MLDSLVKTRTKACALHGVTPPAFGCLAALAFQDSRSTLSLVILPDGRNLHRIREDLEFFLNLPKEGLPVRRTQTRGHSCPPPPLKGKRQHPGNNAIPPSPCGRGWREAPGEGCNAIQVLSLPELPVEPGDRQAIRLERQLDQIGTLSRLATLHSPLSTPHSTLSSQELGNSSPRFMVVTSLPALVQSLPGKRAILEAEIPLQTGMTCSFTGLIQRLNALGYDHESEVAGPGQFAVRGGIIDLYPVNERMPFRLDFFGDEIEEIRAFEPDTQRSAFQVKSLTAAPPPGHSLPAVPAGILQYLPEEVLWQFWEPRLSEENCPQFFRSNPDDTPLHSNSATHGSNSATHGRDPEPSTRKTVGAGLPRDPRLANSVPSGRLAELLEGRAGKGDAWLAYSALDQESILFDESTQRVSLETEPLEHYRLTKEGGHSCPSIHQEDRQTRDVRPPGLKFFHRLQGWQREGYELILSVQSPGEMDRLKELIDRLVGKDTPLHSNSATHGSVTSPLATGLSRDLFDSSTQVLSNLSAGFRCHFPPNPDDTPLHSNSATHGRDPDLDPNPDPPSLPVCVRRTGRRESLPPRPKGIVFVTDSEIFARPRKRLAMGKPRKIAQPQQVDQLLDFSELVEGDYLVHLQNGICLYRGLSRIDAGQGSREVISLEFDDGIILHLPLHESHLVTRYVGLKKYRPTLGKVGSSRWEKTRRRAEEATLDFAARLLQNQASRDSRKGFAFSADGNWHREFEAAFPYRETPDQLEAIIATKNDQEKPQPMDRLICGDVGYGKTEVALRAAFKAVLDGKQVAILGPTTVLTQQHYNTFRQRMSSFPIFVEMLNRFRTRAEQSKILKDLASGRIDIVVGTHRLLSRDVGFKDLGLLVIDEEHRFGVKHKERLKEYRLNADVLSLSATPIPRTLHMALLGARDLSVIESPPINRRPIETIIKNYHPDTVCRAIIREITRGGQVFYLHNRVQSIHGVAARLEEMLPDVRFAVAHGQMHDRTLERIMSQFVDGEYDVLVTTTIIESGLDIPNANTIIIETADRFGLSQLYQIRGRVGRFDRQAYAYLLLHRHARVLDTARRRLAAIKQYNQLGAGFRIALRDLELRGAGNLLGAEQSGHIAGVGFDLYCQLLKQSIARLKGDQAALRIRGTVQLDFVYMGEGKAPEAPIARDSYQALKQAEIEATRGGVLEARIPPRYLKETRLRIEVYRQLAMAEDLASIEELDRSLVDRYGPYPDTVKALLEVGKIRTLAEEKGIDRVESEGNRLKCRIAGAGKGNFIMPGHRFPRLSHKDPFKKLEEILQFLHRQKVAKHVVNTLVNPANPRQEPKGS